MIQCERGARHDFDRFVLLFLTLTKSTHNTRERDAVLLVKTRASCAERVLVSSARLQSG